MVCGMHATHHAQKTLGISKKMIFGNPDYFAIYVDKIADWSYENFDEGVFAYILKNEFFPKNTLNTSSTLGVCHGDLMLLRNNIKINLLDSSEIFNMDDNKIYNYLYELSFNSDQVQDLRFLILIGEMIDTTEPIFAVSHNDKIKFIYLRNKITASFEYKKDDFLNVLDNCIEWMTCNIK